MVTDTRASSVHGRRTDGAGRTVEGSHRVGARLRVPRWTDAHTEAAWFVGECVGAGAVLGIVAAWGRSWREA